MCTILCEMENKMDRAQGDVLAGPAQQDGLPQQCPQAMGEQHVGGVVGVLFALLATLGLLFLFRLGRGLAES